MLARGEDQNITFLLRRDHLFVFIENLITFYGNSIIYKKINLNENYSSPLFFHSWCYLSKTKHQHSKLSVTKKKHIPTHPPMLT